jgi:CelD/BcsL family acetyltransferase involved in cellulose biosynthesis
VEVPGNSLTGHAELTGDLDWSQARNVTDHEILSTLVDWKSAQYRRINSPNIFRYAWIRDLLDKLLDYDTDDFSHSLSILYAGDTVASMHFGIRSRTMLHGWFPSYNVHLAPYSPGMLHWIETIKTADSIGINRIDLGKGTEPFKRRLMTGATKVAEGTVDSRASVMAVRRAWWHTRDRFRNSPAATHARLPVQMLHRVKHWLDVR